MGNIDILYARLLSAGIEAMNLMSSLLFESHSTPLEKLQEELYAGLKDKFQDRDTFNAALLKVVREHPVKGRRIFSGYSIGHRSGRYRDKRRMKGRL